VPAEQLRPVPSLAVEGGATSEAAALFIERAGAVRPGFDLDSPADAEAVVEICRRVDGIALAIELAAARMVSMSPQDVCARLGDRFRLLGGSRRGLERQQTLRNTVQWSYDLLDDDDRLVLERCAVFAGGFDLAAACHLSADRLDEYQVMDRLDSLVRKSLVVAEPVDGHIRYTMLETNRQFAKEQSAAGGSIDAVRWRHARYYAEQAVAYWDLWDGPRQTVAVDWVEAEYSNLRTAFRWAADHGDLDTAAAVAAHTAVLGETLQRFEAVGWAEEILVAAQAADLAQLPRLYTAASFCMFTGRPEQAVGYAQAAVALAADARFHPFDPAWTRYREAVAHILAGRLDRYLEICAGLEGQPGAGHVLGKCGQLLALPFAGRDQEARAIAEDALAAARAHANPYLIALAFLASGMAYARPDPARALRLFREGLAYAREHRQLLLEANITQEAALVETLHGDPGQALALFDATLDSLHRTGNAVTLALVFANLAVCFDRIDQPDVAATIYGASTLQPVSQLVLELPGVVDHLRAVLGDTAFDNCAATGAAMDAADAVAYARHHIELAGRQAANPDSGRP
jgi:hypothetical protein